MKKITLFMITLLIASTTLFANGEKEDSGSTGALKPMTIKSMMFGEKPVQMDVVLDEFYKRTADSLNVTLDIEFNAVPDHKQKLLLRMTAGEEMDMVFDAPWMHIDALSKDGAYQDLEPYFANPDYPGLAEQFDADYLEYNKFHNQLVGIPITKDLVSTEGMLIRKDLMTKYGYDEIMDYDTLQDFAEDILANEPDMVPFSAEGRTGFFRAFENDYEMNQNNIFDVAGMFFVALSDDHKTIEGATFQSSGYWMGDPQEYIADFPAPFNSIDKWSERHLKYKEWNKYLEPDVMSQTDGSALFVSGKAAIQMRGLFSGDRITQEVQQVVPEAELYAFPFSDTVRNMTPKSKYITYQVWNFVCLPVTGKNPDRVMAFMDWIFQSEENHDLLELGIEGVHWEDGGNNNFRRLGEADSQYIFPWYQLTGIPSMNKSPIGLTESEMKYKAFQSDPDRYLLHPFSGFSFDTTPIKSSKAKVDAIVKEIEVGRNNGAYDDPIGVIMEANANARSAGLDEIRAEFLKQAQAFLDAK